MARHDFKSVSCLLRNNPICQLHCLDRQGGIWIPLFLALCSEYTSARFQRVVVYYPVSVWQRCLPAFYTSLSIRGYDAVFGSPPLYNLSEANSCHTSPHVLFMANMFPVNDSKYTSGCEEWFGKLPHTCHHHPPRLARQILLFCGCCLADSWTIPGFSVTQQTPQCFCAQSALTLP